MKRKRIDTLAFFTSAELIEELVNRTTFVGVIVASRQEHKSPNQEHNDFNAYAALPDKEQVVSLLKTMTTNLEQNP